jgi:hypothetical protein
MTANAISLWILGACRTMDDAQIRAHAEFQRSVDVDGAEFWGAVLATLGRV